MGNFTFWSVLILIHWGDIIAIKEKTEDPLNDRRERGVEIKEDVRSTLTLENTDW
jgi:hypothetical protein